MEIPVAASFPRLRLPLFTHTCEENLKSAKPQVLHCSRRIGESNGSSGGPVPRESPSDVEVHQNHLKSISNAKKEKHNDIWQLFMEAQQNIMYLHKQRLLAMKELDRVKNERDSLLDRVEQLEMNKEATVKRGMVST